MVEMNYYISNLNGKLYSNCMEHPRILRKSSYRYVAIREMRMRIAIHAFWIVVVFAWEFHNEYNTNVAHIRNSQYHAKWLANCQYVLNKNVVEWNTHPVWVGDEVKRMNQYYNNNVHEWRKKKMNEDGRRQNNKRRKRREKPTKTTYYSKHCRTVHPICAYCRRVFAEKATVI